MRTHFAMLAAYNCWANARIYASASALAESDYHADRGAFFGSVHRTLSHLLVADRIWLHRFTGVGPTHSRLDDVPFPDRDGLWSARRIEDQRLIACVDALDEAALAGVFTYRGVTNPIEVTHERGLALAHVFNHQAHHRGQAHALLTIAGGHDAAPPIDLLIFQREAAARV